MPLRRWSPVLEPHEKYQFDNLVTQLRADDPKFVRRINRLSYPRRRLRIAVAVLLWTIAPMCIFFGGWTGLIMAVVAVAYGARLIIARSGLTGGTDGFSWWSSRGRASL